MSVRETFDAVGVAPLPGFGEQTNVGAAGDAVSSRAAALVHRRAGISVSDKYSVAT